MPAIQASMFNLTPITRRPADELAGVGGRHPLDMGHTPEGDVVVFKRGDFGSDRSLISRLEPGQAKINTISEVVASHLVAEVLHLPTLVYHEGRLQEADGSWTKGTYSKYTTGFHGFTSTAEIKDADTVVALQVAKSWLGDRDLVHNLSNTWITDAGSGLGGDYGWSLHRSTHVMGLPIGNPEILRELATPERLQGPIEHISSLSNEDIRGHVDRIGRREIEDWSPKLSHTISKKLIYNRNRLSRTPFDFYTVHPHALRARTDRLGSGMRRANSQIGIYYSAIKTSLPKFPSRRHEACGRQA